ncbi:DNA polymerase I [Trichothermofontia sichuanensis B231]|uniref:DNA polymerase I n=1 Tax=Trichothermofontia sichuanensis TaxID=3045816 RepID=UPI002245CEEB|nr:DNA polymerase I [Trichothermofontia sichuanensis]UZQ54910.1 DNA polymerase I [Trichothermofontia sichuanensis B231]
MSPSPADAPPLLLLVDGHSLAFRSYYAFAKSREGGLRTTTGIPTSICYGFLKTLLEVVQTEAPAAIGVAFDRGEPTFRHEADATYKAGRPETPEDFIPDLENLQALLQALQLPILTAPGYEADDVLGTLAQRATAAGYRVKILSGDQDLFQLVDADRGISILHLSGAFAQRGKAVLPQEFGPAEVEAKLGIRPEQVVDYKALCGDASDNIPGVRGIGPKTAVQLLKEYGSLAQIYQSLPAIKPALRQKLVEQQEAARHSQYLAQIQLNVPLAIDLETLRLTGFASERVEPILEKLEFRSFLNQIQALQQQLGGSPATAGGVALTSAEAAAEVTAANPAGAEAEADAIAFFTAAETLAAQPETGGDWSALPVPVEIVDTPEKLTALVVQLTGTELPVAWDTETTSLDPLSADLVGIGCCWQPVGEAVANNLRIAYIPMGHRQGKNLDKAEVLTALRPILENATLPKVLQNAKYDRLVLRRQGIQLAGVVFDPMLASYVINPEASHNLSDLSARYLGIRTQSYPELVAKHQTIADVAIPRVAAYCGMDVYTTFCLVEKLQAELDKVPELARLFKTVELPLESVLAEMEYRGIRIDADYLQQFSQQLEQDLKAIEAQAYQIAGTPFNLASPKQLSQLLFGTLGLNTKKSRKTKLGYSTDASVLEKLQGDHPIIDAILEHRSLAKLKSTYVDALPHLVRANTGRVHTDFNQVVTATGRLSSSNPNLQNIPIRTAFSRQIRQAFIPEPGWLLAAADYSQIELRILAHLSQEPVLIEAYQKNEDVHTLTARLLLEKETVTVEERRLGKVINFGVIYGMGPQRFARETGVDPAEAKHFIDRFNQRYPAVFAYLQRMQKQAIAQGHVETILGRRRYFSFSSDTLRRLQGTDPAAIDLDRVRSLNAYDAGLLRAAANAPIQGSSADIIKIAMVRLQEVLKDYQAHLLLQVHDELVLEVPPAEWPVLAAEIKATMEAAVTLSVPLVVDVRAGENWMVAK